MKAVTDTFELPVRQGLFNTRSVRTVSAAIKEAFPGTTLYQQGDSLFVKVPKPISNTDLFTALKWGAILNDPDSTERFVAVRIGLPGTRIHIGITAGRIPQSTFCRGADAIGDSWSETGWDVVSCRRCLSIVYGVKVTRVVHESGMVVGMEV